MEQLRRQVRKAQRRLGLQQFVGVLGWCLSGSLLVAMVLIIADKLWPLGVDAWVWGAGALGAGVVVAAAWAVIRARGPVDAAIEIDRRFGLKERVSSALALSAEEQETASGQALIHDAVRRARRIEVGEHFKVTPGRQLLMPLVPAVLAILVALFVHPVMDDKQAQAKTDEAVKKQVQQSSESLRRKLAEQRKRAQEQDLKDAEDLFKRLEQETDDLANQVKADRKQAMVKLNDLAREIQKRRDELGGAEKIQNQLNQLKNINRGPADKFLDAVRQGDFQRAKQELEQLKSSLGDLKPEEREQLAEQLNQMEEKLRKLADAHRQAQQDLQQRIDQAREAGKDGEADKLQEQLDRLRQQLPQMNQLQALASKLGQCAQCVRDGQLQDADSTLDQLQSDVESLSQQLEEMEMLNEAMAQLDQSRNQMNCPKCGGAGCPACQGGFGGLGRGQGEGQGNGMGLGQGQGRGDRPEQESAASFYDTRAAVKTGPGGATAVGEVEGPNLRGDVRQEIQEQYQSARRQAADPLVDQQMSKEHRRHAREYFDRLRKGD